MKFKKNNYMHRTQILKPEPGLKLIFKVIINTGFMDMQCFLC